LKEKLNCGNNPDISPTVKKKVLKNTQRTTRFKNFQPPKPKPYCKKLENSTLELTGPPNSLATNSERSTMLE
jgi:hypothetical protein